MHRSHLEVGDLELLQNLTKAHRLTHRGLAQVAGYASHTYAGRLLRGEVKAVEPTPAARIARHFGVDLDLLFVPKAAGNSDRSGQPERKVAA
jgi:transcriptional regulator with XRE-family HTH domain